MLVVFIVGLDITRNERAKSQLPEKAFIGIGYNPQLFNTGERLEMLDFFSWMKRLEEKSVQEWTIWDASGYAIVNKITSGTSKAIFEILENNPSAKEVLTCLITEQDNKGRSQYQAIELSKLRQNCELRSTYLQRLIEVTGITGSYLNSWDVFRTDPKYEEALDISLEYVKFLEKSNPELIDKINFSKEPNAATRLYLPLEIAEALYLEETRVVKGKFGPTSEEFFDEAILDLQERRKVGYTSLRCQLPPGQDRPAYLMSKANRILSSKCRPKTIKRIIRRDPELKGFLEQSTGPLREEGENIVPYLKRVSKELEGLK